MQTDQEPLTTAAAARLLGLTKSTLEKLRVYGGGPAYLKLGRSVRYRHQELQNWLAARVRSSTSEKPAQGSVEQ